jgi:hypothetical protein
LPRDCRRFAAAYDGAVLAPTPADVLDALRKGPATPDALAVRLGNPDRDALWSAIDESVRSGRVASTAEIQCGSDGLCGTSVPTILSLAGH